MKQKSSMLAVILGSVLLCAALGAPGISVASESVPDKPAAHSDLPALTPQSHPVPGSIPAPDPQSANEPAVAVMQALIPLSALMLGLGLLFVVVKIFMRISKIR